MTTPRSGPRRAPRGFALLALVAVLLLGISWALFSGFSPGGRVAEDRARNAEVLNQAKQALIAWTAMKAIDEQERNPGRLPCPEPAAYAGDPDCEGIAAPGLCKTHSAPTCTALGRLPWRTLGLPKLLDASGEPLWYVASPDWALPNSSATLQINSNSLGKLTLDRQPNSAVALVIAPGGALNVAASAACEARNQSRGAVPPDFRDYMECDNANSPPDANFASSGPADSFNDQLVAITAAEILPGIEAAIAKRIERDIVPEFAKAARTMPGASDTPGPGTSFYPYAAPWGDPLAAAYRGAAGNSQGLLPLARARKACTPGGADPACNATLASKPCIAGDTQCDLSSVVTWQVGEGTAQRRVTRSPNQEWTVTWDDGSTVTIAVGPGYPSSVRIGKVYCGDSSPGAIFCYVWYGRQCEGKCASGSAIDLVVTARTRTTAGLAFRRVNPALLGYPFARSSALNSIVLQSDASAIVTTGWRPPAIFPWCDEDDCMWTTIVIPALYIEDNIDFQARLRDKPASGKDLSWFLRNNWHQLAYFAFAPSLAPGGSGACANDPDAIEPCLRVTNDITQITPDNKQRAILLMMGRVLSGKDADRKNGKLEGFLDSPENRDSDRNFEQRRVGGGSNDRVVVVDAIP